MRADLARREPEWLARWARERQYERILAARARKEGAPPFVLHDGPPYPTGGIHYGTVLNKVLKDIVVRSQLLMGKRAVFRPGWDCHGLPIEQQVEKELGEGRQGSWTPPPSAASCEAHALKFVDVMRGEFKRLGCLGPVGRSVPDAVQGLRGDDRAAAGGVRAARGSSTATRSRCTGASSTARRSPRPRSSTRTTPRRRSTCASRWSTTSAKRDAARSRARRRRFVIWTTTPWTLPANLAIVANPELDYVAIPRERRLDEYLVVAAGPGRGVSGGDGARGAARSWIAMSREGPARARGSALRAALPASPTTPCRQPFGDETTGSTSRATRRWRPAPASSTRRPGTAPTTTSSGREHGLPIYAPVDEAGASPPRSSSAQFIGAKRLRGQPADRRRAGRARPAAQQAGRDDPPPVPLLLALQEARSSSAPPSSGSPASARPTTRRRCATGRWPRSRRTKWIPTWGENRIRGMIEARPDWCLSRQRVWGVPIPAFRCAQLPE